MLCAVCVWVRAGCRGYRTDFPIDYAPCEEANDAPCKPHVNVEFYLLHFTYLALISIHICTAVSHRQAGPQLAKLRRHQQRAIPRVCASFCVAAFPLEAAPRVGLCCNAISRDIETCHTGDFVGLHGGILLHQRHLQTRRFGGKKVRHYL